MSQEIQKYKYGRTFHLPFTAHKTTDDKIWEEGALLAAFSGKEIVITEKMDGECTSVYHDGTFHARSIDGRHHPSRNRMVGIAKTLGLQLPANFRICGENLFAQHSIIYNSLPSYFLVFGIYDDKNMCLDWDETKEICEMIGARTVPELFRGEGSVVLARSKELLGSAFPLSLSGVPTEGYVMRTKEGFHYDDQGSCVAKWVRFGHVQTDEHWMHRKICPNGLKE